MKIKLLTPATFGTLAQYFDGTIVGDELIDKSGNNRNADIIDNDIIGCGFPYKSVAMIRQKAANFGIIPDPTNFWYDSGGTPNDIPVVSLFQNIDYANQIFTKHQSQVLDANEVEVTEPKVMEIATYASPLTGTFLTNANNYFGVPDEMLCNVIWVDYVNGSDSNPGTKALPFKTLTKANTGTYGKTIYVKTGNYSDTATIDFQGCQRWYCIGYCTSVNTVSPSFSVTGSSLNYLQGLIVTPCSGARAFYFISGNNNTLNRCKITANGSFSKTFQLIGDVGNSVKNCVIINSVDTPHIDIRANACEISGSIFGGVKATGSDVISFNSTDIAGVQEVKYNKFVTTLATNRYLLLFNVSGNYVIKNNTILSTGGYSIQGLLTGSTLTGCINYSHNYIKPSGLSDGIILSQNATDVIYYNIDHNTIIIENGTMFNGIITINNQPQPSVTNNYIDTYVLASCIDIYGTSPQGPANVRCNTVMTRADGDCIVIGYDGSSSNDDAYNESTIIGNKCFGVRYFNPTSPTNLGHGISIFNSKDCKVKYNYCNGTNHLAVFKYSDRSIAVQQTDAVCAYNIGINNDSSLFAKTTGGIKFYNNTTYADSPFILEVAGGIYLFGKTGPATNNEFKNNIFIDKTPYNPNVSLIQVDPVGCLSGLISDYNVFFSLNNNSISKVLMPGTVTYDLAAWRALGYDANSIYQDAPFTSIGSEDFSTQVPIPNGCNLGSGYSEGLCIDTKYDSCVPEILTKIQTSIWQRGAYVQGLSLNDK